ncbi:MAG: ribosomal-processing cysteine protease Prp [Phytoplasma sp.]|uniref:ribosomal-processing cysteine protease Prp n=1 Tax=Phytoplasma sp. TaxID=2155 RepID=UPI002B409AE3|nr:ribosomal-processing cysteine protease Prp [Phytoplasma sp.]WRH06668.1 MAG: ribosomal-processing cysteine protease Prp [Phytoplasma sp.]
MIKYFFTKDDGKIEKVNITGHSLYDIKNKDIVCASVSTAIIMTLNAIEICQLKSNISYDLKEGFFILKLLKFDDILNKLLSNLEYTLKDLNKNYHKYLQEIKK